MSLSLPTSAKSVLDYWFGPLPLSPATASQKASLWWQGSADTDFDLERRFGKLAQAAARGQLAHWADTPRGALALIILLDQLPRNLHRGSAEAFAQDEKALVQAKALVASNGLESLHLLEQVFCLLPFEHSEQLDDQRFSVAAFANLHRHASEEWHQITQSLLEFAQQHFDIVEEFGRFPHRNQALQRTSSTAELTFLQGGGATFGQS